MRPRMDSPNFARMRDDIERMCARFSADMENMASSHRQDWKQDWKQRREERRERRAGRRMARCTPGGFWQWWMIFPLVFFVIPALSGGRGWDRDGWERSFERAGDRVGDGIGLGVERMFDGWTGLLTAPFGALARMFGEALGISTQAAMALLIAAVAVNLTVIVLALRAGGRRS